MDPVTITAREIYDAVLRVSGQVAGIELSLKEMYAVKADHEARIRALERGRWPLPALSVVLSIAAIAVTIFTIIH